MNHKAMQKAVEPFALDFWQHELAQWLPDSVTAAQIGKQPYNSGL